jgi:peptidoglycan/xylan/chitin deacetylase (PgdA/CDA1 family)
MHNWRFPQRLAPVIDSALAHLPLAPLLMPAGDRLGVLAYHKVEDAVVFESHAEYLRQTRQPAGMAEFLAAVSARRPLPSRTVLVTFDDGDRSVYERGAPVLKRHDIPAIVFVVADLIDTDRAPWFDEVPELVKNGGANRRLGPLPPRALVSAMKRLPDAARREVLDELRSTADTPAPPVPQLRGFELRELESMGLEIGNHTLTHPCLDQCSAETVEAEIVGAHTRLTEILGHPPRTFAYPNGNYSPVAAEILRGLGYEAAFLFDHRISVFPPADAMQISRLRVDSTTRLDRFKTILNGVHPAIHHALRRS